MSPAPQRRGKALEERVAKTVSGLRYPGQAGDVVAWGPDGVVWVLECKYRKGFLLDRKDQLGRWVDQAKGNAQRHGGDRRWGIVVYGGRGTEALLVVPLAWALDLFRPPVSEGPSGAQEGGDRE